MKVKQGYWVIWRRKNGKMAEQFFTRYWEAVQKKQGQERAGSKDVSMQKGIKTA
jgi:hypothetical protein